MNSNSVFERFPQPREVRFQSLGRNGYTVFAAVGIVNPFGPTIEVIAADGLFDDSGCLPIVRMSVNPFSQSGSIIGQVTVGNEWDPFADLNPFPESCLKACPSLLLPSVLLDHDQSVRFYARFLQQYEDGANLLAKVKRFPQDPWKRVDAEVKGVSSGFLSRLLRGQRDCTPEKLSREQAKELAELQLSSDSLKAEFKAFVFAWNGSIKFQGANQIATNAMSLNAIAEFLAQVSFTCRMPEGIF